MCSAAPRKFRAPDNDRSEGLHERDRHGNDHGMGLWISSTVGIIAGAPAPLPAKCRRYKDISKPAVENIPS